MNSDTGEMPAAAGGLKIKVLGVGGAGANLLPCIADFCGAEVTCALLHTNARALTLAPTTHKLLLGAKAIHGLGSGGDSELGRLAAESDAAAIREICAGSDLVFVVAGLGRGTGSGAAPVVARVARESGALVLGLVATPFDFEGGRRAAQAAESLRQMRMAADGVICLPNQKITKLLNENTSLLDAFKFTNGLVAEGVHGIWRMLTRGNLMQVNFGDLCAALRGRHAESAFASVKAQGEARLRELLEKMAAHPFLDDGQAIAGADSILVNLTGGTDLTMAEVTRVMEQINRHAENAQIMVGASVEEGWENQLQITIIASRRGQPETERSRLPEPASSETGSSASSVTEAELDTQFFHATPAHRPPSRYVAPAPELPPEKTAELMQQQHRAAGGRGRRSLPKLRQGQLPLEIISKGRFEKVEPTIHKGEDLDVPTYIRRGIVLN